MAPKSVDTLLVICSHSFNKIKIKSNLFIYVLSIKIDIFMSITERLFRFAYGSIPYFSMTYAENPGGQTEQYAQLCL